MLLFKLSLKCHIIQYIIWLTFKPLVVFKENLSSQLIVYTIRHFIYMTTTDYVHYVLLKYSILEFSVNYTIKRILVYCQLLVWKTSPKKLSKCEF